MLIQLQKLHNQRIIIPQIQKDQILLKVTIRLMLRVLIGSILIVLKLKVNGRQNANFARVCLVQIRRMVLSH
ncbi:uncharacterized protein DS421_12g377150 [Arachis hypogaea]|nr:uncharacterized protein DS421_12g377150 [Arachis hypogaea]